MLNPEPFFPSVAGALLVEPFPCWALQPLQAPPVVSLDIAYTFRHGGYDRCCGCCGYGLYTNKTR